MKTSDWKFASIEKPKTGDPVLCYTPEGFYIGVYDEDVDVFFEAPNEMDPLSIGDKIDVISWAYINNYPEGKHEGVHCKD